MSVNVGANMSKPGILLIIELVTAGASFISDCLITGILVALWTPILNKSLAFLHSGESNNPKSTISSSWFSIYFGAYIAPWSSFLRMSNAEENLTDSGAYIFGND